MRISRLPAAPATAKREAETCLRLFAIFCKIEMDTTNQIPGRVYTGMVNRLPLFGELRD
jgi:hypothetical protein